MLMNKNFPGCKKEKFMIKNCISFALIGLMLIAANAPGVFAQTKTADNDLPAAKIKANVAKRGAVKNKRVKVIMLDGKKLEGDIGQVGEESFELTDSKTGQSSSIAYRDVSQVRGGGLSKGAKIGIAAGIGAAVVAVYALSLLVRRICNESSC
jgi:hypothetical protein